MNFIERKIVKVVATLKLSQIRPFKDAILKGEFKKYLDHIFKGEDRIYLPFTSNKEVKVPSTINNYIESKGYSIADYKAGLAVNKKGRLLKIGKLLKDEPELFKEFNTSRSGSKKDNLMIVISRHPYDIVGASTDRGWESCLNLDGGSNKHYLHKEIDNGTLVAYVINGNDKNIEKPVCRRFIKQWINVKDKDDVIIYPEKKVYGTEVPGFRDAVLGWIKTFQKLKGIYQFNKESYLDNPNKDENTIDENEKFLNSRKVSDKLQEYYNEHPDDRKNSGMVDFRLEYYKNNPDDEDAKKDKNEIIREIYYINHPDDEDAKKDKDEYIRLTYYRRNPKNKDAKNDKYGSIRKMYYINHPDDKD